MLPYVLYQHLPLTLLPRIFAIICYTNQSSNQEKLHLLFPTIQLLKYKLFHIINYKSI